MTNPRTAAKTPTAEDVAALKQDLGHVATFLGALTRVVPGKWTVEELIAYVEATEGNPIALQHLAQSLAAGQ